MIISRFSFLVAIMICSLLLMTELFLFVAVVVVIVVIFCQII